MTPSIYNCTVKLGTLEILYNTITNKHIILSNEVKDCLNGSSVNANLLLQLKNQNFLIEEDIDEKRLVETLFLQRRYSSRSYQLILNTTLDCNLCCWYCYENHVAKSFMSIDVVNRILKHLELKLKSDHFEILELSFFGGEPMMNYKAIAALLQGVQILAEEYTFKIYLLFVTNGTLISDSYINLLKHFQTRFQITIDGDKNSHNIARKYKLNVGNHDSYSQIIKGLQTLNSACDKFHFTIRINYDNNVLKNIPQLISDIDFLNRKRTAISLQRIWQHEESDIDTEILMEAVNYINEQRFVINTFYPTSNFHSCYADNYNQAIINYNGDVYKCTARDFSSERSLGYLNSLGIIEWDTNEIKKRLSLTIPVKCRNCKLLPSCPGICSQKLSENKLTDEISCPYSKGLNENDIILLNIKQQLIARKNENI